MSNTIVPQGVIERNKLIFDFMGCVHSKEETIDKWEMELLKYHSSWDAIMPVWQKFRDLFFPSDESLNEKHGEWTVALEWYMYSSNDPSRFAERLYYAIQWYNEQTKIINEPNSSPVHP